MNDKVVSNETKGILAILLNAFAIFLQIADDRFEKTEPEDYKFGSFLDISLKFSDAMETLNETMKKHRPADLTIDGCIAILLDMSSVVEINLATSHILEVDIETEYLKMKEMLSDMATIVFDETEI